MTDFNPLAGAILGSAQAQGQAEAQKQRQLRRAQTVRKNVAAEGDRFEHQVESAEELPPAGDDAGKRQPQERKRHPRRHGNDDRPHIDVKA